MNLREELRSIVDDKLQRRTEQAKLDKLSYEAGRVKRITEDFVGDVRDAAQKGEEAFVVLDGIFVPYNDLLHHNRTPALTDLPEDSTARKVAQYIESKEMPVELSAKWFAERKGWYLTIFTTW